MSHQPHCTYDPYDSMDPAADFCTCSYPRECCRYTGPPFEKCSNCGGRNSIKPKRKDEAPNDVKTK